MTSGRPPGPLILVVDDVADNREVYGQILAFKGYRVLNAANGTEGLGLAPAHRPPAWTTTWSSHACPTTSWPPSVDTGAQAV